MEINLNFCAIFPSSPSKILINLLLAVERWDELLLYGDSRLLIDMRVMNWINFIQRLRYVRKALKSNLMCQTFLISSSPVPSILHDNGGEGRTEMAKLICHLPRRVDTSTKILISPETNASRQLNQQREMTTTIIIATRRRSSPQSGHFWRLNQHCWRALLRKGRVERNENWPLLSRRSYLWPATLSSSFRAACFPASSCSIKPH